MSLMTVRVLRWNIAPGYSPVFIVDTAVAVTASAWDCRSCNAPPSCTAPAIELLDSPYGNGLRVRVAIPLAS